MRCAFPPFRRSVTGLAALLLVAVASFALPPQAVTAADKAADKTTEKASDQQGAEAPAGGLPAKFAANGACLPRFKAATTQAYGMDVSKYQGKIDWTAVNEKTGVLYAFMRVSYGMTTDPAFAENWKGAGEQCLLRGLYHFFVEDDDPADQAKALYKRLEAAGALDPELTIVADIERGSAVAAICNDKDRAASFAKKAYQFIVAFENQSGRRMTIYTSRDFWNCLPTTKLISKDRPLWIAEYTTASAPKLPKEWDTWHFWQFYDQGRVAGIGGPIDADRFNGAGPDLLDHAAGR